jgi:hypothetical protein
LYAGTNEVVVVDDLGSIDVLLNDVFQKKAASKKVPDNGVIGGEQTIDKFFGKKWIHPFLHPIFFVESALESELVEVGEKSTLFHLLHLCQWEFSQSNECVEQFATGPRKRI